MIDALAQPIVELIRSFGSGTVGGPTDALRTTTAAIDSVHALGRTAICDLDDAWSGEGARAALDKARQVQTFAGAIADRGADMADVVQRASADVRNGIAELERILQSFVGLAVSAGPALATPAGQLLLVGAAIDHLGRALAVVATVRTQLEAHTAAMLALVTPETLPALPTLPGMPSLPGLPELPGSPALPPPTGSGSGAFTGSGVQITLPDGSTATAPNAEAAAAVRAALGQQGVPYVWGGTSPGQGLDCSGLTQYAYQQAGLDIPRLAQDQGVGTPVDPSNVMPGDLAVWDGHVAMAIGNGQLVEAGDPVEVGPLRTSNSGMTFHGFYRPTA